MRYFGLIGALVLAGCQHTTAMHSSGVSPLVAGSVIHMTFECVPPGALRPDGKPATCEPSAAVATGQGVLVANDKPVSGEDHRAVFRMFIDHQANTPRLEPVQMSPLLDARKLEDFSRLPGADIYFATTAFDRQDSARAAWDAYNTVLVWNDANGPERALVLQASEREGVVSSLGLRAVLRQALASEAFPDGPPYFKIEGLAATPGNRLLFGVRARGATYQDFEYVAELIALPVRREGRQITLGDVGERIYRFAATHPDIPDHHQPMGLSSIEYDAVTGRYLLLTTYELEDTDRGVGAYLWSLTPEALAAQEPAQLVRTVEGAPLHFAHKAEALTRLNERQIVVIHDDDRITGRALEMLTDPNEEFSRAGVHEAALSVVVLTR